MQSVRVAVVPGDGIGIEVVREGGRVLDVAAELDGGIRFSSGEFPWGCRCHAGHGVTAPEGFLDTLRGFYTLFPGAAER